MLLVVFVVGLAVWSYVTGECDLDEYCDEAGEFWPIFWTGILVVSSIVGLAVGGAAMLVCNWWGKPAA